MERTRLPLNFRLRTLVVLAAIFLILLIVAAVRWRGSPTALGSKATLATTAVTAPLKTLDLNRDFSFPMKDTNGQLITNLSYTLTSAELRDQIIIQGQTATAAPGRVFLILNLKLRNDSNQAVSLNTGDYVRLSVNGSSDWLAADIHNDPVVAQPISTKLTRLGFPVNLTDNKFILQVGEIKGNKTTVPIEFK